MANINLLPWRAELRKQRQNEFYAVIGLVLAAAAFILYVVSSYYSAALDNQNRRNSFITTEAKVLDAKIAEIRELRETRQQLIERMELIQALQGNRPVIVRIFDEIVRVVPDDLYLTSVTVKGDLVTVKGMSKSNSQVSELIRNFSASEWFVYSDLLGVLGKGEFGITLKLVQPKMEEE